MTNLAKLEFVALDISSKNYLSWILDAEIHLDAMGLEDTIKDGNETSSQNKANAMIFFRYHLHEELKMEYLTNKNPFILWQNLKESYDHQKTIILPKARYDWIHLRLQDFKSVSEYNSAMFNISSKLKLYGDNITDEDMLEKTFSTFHASNVLLQQQYRERGFKKYSELISYLFVAEQNNELLMKNHVSRLTGSAAFTKVNVMRYNSNYGRGRSRGRGRGHWRGRFNYRNYDGRNSSNSNKPSQNEEKQERGKNIHSGDTKKGENIYYRCGMKGHWSRTCHTAKHLVDLYQYSLNMSHLDVDMTHLDVVDFFEQTDEKVDNN